VGEGTFGRGRKGNNGKCPFFCGNAGQGLLGGEKNRRFLPERRGTHLQKKTLTKTIEKESGRKGERKFRDRQKQGRKRSPRGSDQRADPGGPLAQKGGRLSFAIRGGGGGKGQILAKYIRRSPQAQEKPPLKQSLNQLQKQNP